MHLGTKIILTASLAISVMSANLMLPEPAQAQSRKVMQVSVDQVRPTGDVQERRRFIAHFRQSLSGRVATRIAGSVDSLAVTVGDRVEKGTPLIRLAADSRKAERDARRADLSESQAAVQAANAASDLAARELARLKALRGSSAFRQQAYDEKEIEVDRLQAEIARSKAAIARARANLRQAELALAWCLIEAPFGGVVSAVHTSPGDFVQAGAQIVTIQADTGMAIEADVPVADLPLLQPGMMMDVERSYGLYPAAARLKAVVPVENALARTVPVWLDFVPDAVGQPPRVGESLILKAAITAPKGQVSLHKDAVLWSSDGATVFRIVDNKAERVSVRVGTAIGDRFLVNEGVNEGDWLVIRGNERLRPGAEVTSPDLPKAETSE